MSKIEGPIRRGRPHERWKDKIKEYYMSVKDANRVILEQTRMECFR